MQLRIMLCLASLHVAISCITATAQVPVKETRMTASPTVGALGTFGNTEMKSSSGGIQKEINLFDVKSGSLTYSPSLQYYSTGVKVDDYGSRVGISWTENLTAVIYRTVRSIPDERASSHVEQGPEILSATDNANYQRLISIEAGNASGSGMDGEYDLFSYNIFGLSGSFLIINGQAKILNHQTPIDIKLLSSSPYKFILTTPDGNKYYFDDPAKMEHTSFSTENTCDDGSSPRLDIATAWFINKLVSPLKDTISFDYGALDYKYIYDYSESYTYRDDQYPAMGTPQCEPYIFSHTSCIRRKRTVTRYITSVSSGPFTVNYSYRPRKDINGEVLLNTASVEDAAGNEIKNIVFGYETFVANTSLETLLSSAINGETVEITGLKTRYFLRSLSITNSKDQGQQHYTFDYIRPDDLPHRFSFSQDVDGFYNGIPNQYFVPKKETYIYTLYSHLPGQPSRHVFNLGDREATSYNNRGLLSKITYPTGGNDTIIYEPNMYSSTDEILIKGSLTGQGTNQNQATPYEFLSDSLNIPFNQTIKYGLSCDYWNATPPSDDEGKFYYLELQVIDLLTQQPIQFHDAVTTIRLAWGKNRYDSLYLSGGRSYKFKLTLYGQKTYGSFDINYYSGRQYQSVNKISTGNRVKQIVANPVFGKSVARNYDYRTFRIEDNKLIFENRISIINPGINYFFTHNYEDCKIQHSLGVFSLLYNLYSIRSKNNFDAGVFNGLSYNFTHITEFIGDAQESFTARVYNVSSNEAGGVIMGSYTSVVPMSNNGWNNGLEIRRFNGTKTNNEYKILSSIDWFYRKKQETIYNGYIVSKDYEPIFIFDMPHLKFSPYKVIHTPIFSRWFTLDSVINRTYNQPGLGNGMLTIKESHSYNPKDKLMLSTESMNSKNQKLIKEYHRPRYMIDAGQDPSGVYLAMVNDNITDPVIEEISKVNTITKKLVRTNYYIPNPGMYLPKSVQIQQNDGPMETRLLYNQYSKGGNLLSYTADNLPVSNFIWGYGNQHIIAKVDNIDYSTIQSVLGSTQIENFSEKKSPTSAELQLFLAPLRTDARTKDAFVTTYEYLPLIGMVRNTTPNNMSQYFEFDGSGRLMVVRDHNKNVLKHFQYEYIYKPDPINPGGGNNILFRNNTSSTFVIKLFNMSSGQEMQFNIVPGTNNLGALPATSYRLSMPILTGVLNGTIPFKFNCSLLPSGEWIQSNGQMVLEDYMLGTSSCQYLIEVG